MVKRLTLSEQRDLIKALPAHRLKAVRDHCTACEMKGEGLKDIMKSVGKVLGPVAKELSPVLVKELLIPFIKHKAGIPAGKGKKGGAVTLGSKGGAVTLGSSKGCGKKKKTKKGGALVTQTGGCCKKNKK